MISFEKMTEWKNLKAVLSGAGKGETCYPDFSTFTVRELIHNFDLYIIHGIAPSPIIKMKFKPQSVDCVIR